MRQKKAKFFWEVISNIMHASAMRKTKVAFAIVGARERVQCDIEKLEYLNSFEPLLERGLLRRMFQKNGCLREMPIVLFALDRLFFNLYQKRLLVEFIGNGHLRYLSCMSFFKNPARYSSVFGIKRLPRFVTVQRHLVWCHGTCGNTLRAWHDRWKREFETSIKSSQRIRLSKVSL